MREYLETIQNHLPGYVTSIEAEADRGTPTLHVRSDRIVEVLQFLKQHSLARYRSLVEITAVDYPEREKRFDLDGNYVRNLTKDKLDQNVFHVQDNQQL
jgi:NADH:ubiquinone oxidoreductase subunit C